MSTAVRQALFTRLSTTSAVTSKLAPAADGYNVAIYHELAPEGAAFPYIIFSKTTGSKVRAFSAPEAFGRQTWMVKAVDRSRTSNLAEAIAEAVDAVLDGGTLTVIGKTVADLHHVGDVDYMENRGDQEYRHHGASYRVVLT